MTWLEIPEFFEQLAAANSNELNRRKPTPEQIAASSAHTISLHDEGATQRIQAFVSDFRWPDDTPLELLIDFFARIHQAKALVSFVIPTEKSLSLKAQQTDLPDGYFLQWLLIDYWHHAGLWRQVFSNPTPNV